MLVKDLPEYNRPREKLLSLGPRKLADQELIAILLNTGIHQKPVLELADEMLKTAGSLLNLAKMTPEEMENKFKGLGKAKIAKLLAAFELSNRIMQSTGKEYIIRSANDVFYYFRSLGFSNVEKFNVLLLKSNRGIIKDIEISSGDLTSTVVSPREIFKAAIDHRAYSIILVHNHPSGTLQPSREDIELTKRLREAGEILNIPVDDHLIITSNDFFSFAVNGLI